jgi:hypothetical protein
MKENHLGRRSGYESNRNRRNGLKFYEKPVQSEEMK